MKIPIFIHIFNKYLLSINYFVDTENTKIRQLLYSRSSRFTTVIRLKTWNKNLDKNWLTL